MSGFHWLRPSASGRREYATNEEFIRVFNRERMDLETLARLLTANPESSKLCLKRAFRECMASGSVSKEWAHSWTRRTVIRNAISLIMNPKHRSFADTDQSLDNGMIAFPSDDLLETTAGFEFVIDLPDFERFVFVICVLERYSIHDCALLLGCSDREAHQTRKRVVEQLNQLNNSSLTFRDVLDWPTLDGGI